VTASYLLKRLLLMVYTLLVVSLLVFGITQLLPADAAVTLLGQNATPEALAAVRERLGLDAPAWQQYWHWLTQALQGNFGVSMRNGLEVAPTLLTALSRSLLLAVCALILIADYRHTPRHLGGGAPWQNRRCAGECHLLYRHLLPGVRHRHAGAAAVC